MGLEGGLVLVAFIGSALYAALRASGRMQNSQYNFQSDDMVYFQSKTLRSQGQSCASTPRFH